MSYILISVPTDRNPKNTKTKLRNAVQKHSSDVVDFKIPPLKIGTLDQLMQLSDELVKVDTHGESVVNKIEHAFYDMLANKPAKNEEKKHKDKSSDKTKKKVELRIGLNMQQGQGRKGQKKPDTVNLLPEEYIKNFKWDRIYDASKPMKILSEDMQKIILKADDDLKNQMSTYSDFKGALEIIERKETGTLMVKPLGNFVHKNHMVSSAHLTTLMVVIPKNREDYFLDNYELLERKQRDLQQQASSGPPADTPMTRRGNGKKDPMNHVASDENKLEHKETPEERSDRLAQEVIFEEERKRKAIERKKQEARDRLNGMCENVIPGSAKLLTSERDFVLYRVVVFRKGAESMKRLFRQERFTVRQFKYDPDDVNARKDQKQRLKDKRRNAWNSVVRWCKVYYERIFKLWIHVKALRCFVETILRYGLPPDFQAYLIKIKGRSIDKLRSSLKTLYKPLGNDSLMNDDSSDQIVTTGIAGLSGEFHSYVSLDLNLIQDD